MKFNYVAQAGGTGEDMKTTWISDVQAGSYDGKDVELKGWIKRSRGSKIRFVVLRDSTGTIQCVAKSDTVGDECFEELKSALIEASVITKAQRTRMKGQMEAMN